MPTVIKLVGLVRGGTTEHDGRYLVAYDPAPVGYPAGDVLLHTTANIDQAKRFHSHEDAHNEWRRIDSRKPIRPDGKPNRPLIAYTIQIQRVDA